jgi:hypothetical protein
VSSPTGPLLEPDLDPDAPGLDEDTRRRRRVLAEMTKMTPHELLDLAVRAGIFTPEGEFTESYKDNSPSPYRDRLADSALDFPILDVLLAPEVRGPMRYEQVAEALQQRWVVNENEVLLRLRRMAAAGFLATEDPTQLSFSATDLGRAARER